MMVAQMAVWRGNPAPMSVASDNPPTSSAMRTFMQRRLSHGARGAQRLGRDARGFLGDVADEGGLREESPAAGSFSGGKGFDQRDEATALSELGWVDPGEIEQSGVDIEGADGVLDDDAFGQEPGPPHHQGNIGLVTVEVGPVPVVAVLEELLAVVAGEGDDDSLLELQVFEAVDHPLELGVETPD